MRDRLHLHASVSPLRVLIVAEHASATFGGEAFLPLHYFRLLRARGVEAWLVTHARVRKELTLLLPDEATRMYFVKDTRLQVALDQLGQRMPNRVETVTTGAVMHLDTQIRQRRLVRKLVKRHGIDVVHEPIPVSPTQPSASFGLGAPVVIGPMNGGMSYPPAFAHLQSPLERVALKAARSAANAANIALPGKRKAALLLVANARTRAALPAALSQVPTRELVENGVDLERFTPKPERLRSAKEPLRVAFVGRLIQLKAVDLLIEAVADARRSHDVRLEIFGDGEVRPALEAQTSALGLGDAVTFHGFVPQRAVAQKLLELDALAMPSLHECGGAVVLEAMASGLPVIATKWGGPADYLDDTCGILVEPSSAEHLRDGFARALGRLAEDAALVLELGRAARARAQLYDWERKIDTILALYAEVRARAPRRGVNAREEL